MLRFPNPRKEIWNLEIHYWPTCPADKRPCGVTMGFFFDEATAAQHPEWYLKREFQFDCPPSRTDFESMVNMLPYMQDSDILPVIKANPWCIVPLTNKAHSQDLKVDGKVVGRIDVSKSDLFCGTGYMPIYLPSKLLTSIINRKFRVESDRQEAQRYMDQSENEVLEQVLQLMKDNERAELDEGDFRQIINKHLDKWKKTRLAVAA